MSHVVVNLLSPVALSCFSDEDGEIELTFCFASAWEIEKYGSGTLSVREAREPRSDEGIDMLGDYLNRRGDPVNDLRGHTGVGRGPIRGYFLLEPPQDSKLRLVIPKRLFRELLVDARRGVYPEAIGIKYMDGEPLPLSKQQKANRILVVTEVNFSTTLIK